MSETMNSTISRAGDAIIELVSTSVAGASFDTTIRAIVQEKVDSATGKYKLQYQDSVMYAFVDDVKTTYSKGTEVYVLIPKNDFTSDKRIIGSVKTLGEDYTLVLTEEDKYKKIGASAFGESNLIKEDGDYAVDQSFSGSRTLFGFNNSPLKGYYDSNFLTYLRNENTEAIWLEATFETDIEYGVNKKYSLDVVFDPDKKDDKGEPIYITASINQDNIVGNPFCLRESQQIVIFDFKGDGTESIDWSKIAKINSVKLTTTGFVSGKDYVKVKNIKLYAVSALTQEQLNAPYAYIFTPDGTIVAENGEVTLKGILRINQQVQTNVKYFWFIEDLTVNKDSGGDKYHDYGGRGWKLLNGTTDNKDGTFTVNNTGQDVRTITDEDMVVPAQRYKCVIAKDKDSRYSDIVEITSTGIGYKYKIMHQIYKKTTIVENGEQKETWTKVDDSSVLLQSNLEEDQKIELEIQQSLKEDDIVHWYRKELFDSEWIEVTDEASDRKLTIEYENINVSTQIRAIVNGFNTETVTITAKAEIPDPTPQYQLVIENANQTFIYDEDGRSPTHPAKTFRDNEPKTLSFKLYDTYAAGTEDSPYDITNKASSPIWKISADGLVNLKDSDWDLLEENEQIDKNKDKKYQLTASQCSFLIKDAWLYNTTDNQITLTVEYWADPSNPATKATITAKTNFTFLKEGDPGTNGTGVAIVVEKKATSNSVISNNDLKVIKYTGAIGLEVINATIAQKTHGVYKATITEGDKVYYGYYIPPVTPEEEDNVYSYSIDGTPSQYVVYDADGTNPRYSDWKFKKTTYKEVTDEETKEKKIVVDQTNPVTEVKFSLEEQKSQDWQCDTLRNTIPKTFNSTLASTEGVFKLYAYEEIVSTTGQGEAATTNTTYTLIAEITLLASLNRHAFSMVNKWDGNLKIDDGNNYILSATVAAGKKDDNNTFTGVMIGTVGDSTSTNSNNNRTGFFGFYQGAQTAFIDADDGSTRLGNSEKTLFQIGNKYSEEFLRSSNYVEGSKVTTVTLRESSTGVSTTYPSAQWGNNNITIVYAESTHVTPIGAIKGTGYSISFSEPTNVQYIKGYLGNSSVEKYFYVTAATTTATLYKDSNFSYQLNSSIGMKIDLKNGSIFAPGYYLDGASGNATFSGEVTATSGHFSQGVTLGNSNISVGAMLNSLSSAVSNVNYAIAELSSKITKTEAESYINSTVQTEVDKIEIPTLPKYIEETKITSTTIESPIITGGTIIGGTFQAKVNEATGIKDVFTMSFINNNGNYYARLASGWAPMMITTTFGQIILTTGSSIKLDASGGVYLGDQKIQVEQ